MKLTELVLTRFRSVRAATIPVGTFNLFIGANASGKSTILDSLRFLREGVRAADYREPMVTRGGIVHLAWKGEPANRVGLRVTIGEGAKSYEWSVELLREGYDFAVKEEVSEHRPGAPPVSLLRASCGEGWWWSGQRDAQVSLKQVRTGCALAAAAADASFPARGVAEFVRRWGFFDPNPFLLRRDWGSPNGGGLDPFGRNLGETLHALSLTSPDRLREIVDATRAVLGTPARVEPRESEGRFHFVQDEPGLQFPVHQIGASSGTLRMLALMTALIGEPGANLVGIEEPENYVHPAALSALIEHLSSASDHIQFMVTTHSPLVLDVLDRPSAVRIVRRDASEGTSVSSHADPQRVRKALQESGFGLGEFHQMKGFGAA